jgi:ubiquinone/menaquinone biosynthesis C-methylase UbiE
MSEHVCPWWLGYSFDNPLRRLVHDPRSIFAGLVAEGQTVADIGCGLGYFSIALANLVGPSGKVIAVDIQQEMLLRASRRAERKGVADRIEFRSCAPDSPGLSDRIDFALAFWVVHELPDQEAFFSEVAAALEPAGRLLVAEPIIHVPASRFEATAAAARESGLEVAPGPDVRFSRAITCSRPVPP